MSKLYDKYLLLKKNELNADNTLFLFKSGIFYIFLNDDAMIASSLLNLKITHITDDIIKCGFPINSLEKCTALLRNSMYDFKIIDMSKNISYTIDDYSMDSKIKDLLHEISSINVDSLSIKEAYDFIDKIKISANSIIGGN